MPDLFTQNGEVNEDLIVGTIEVGDGELYIIDIESCSPDEPFFEYSLIKEKYKGSDITFATDSAQNVRILYTVSEDNEGFFYAYSSEKDMFYPVSRIWSNDGEYYYAISVNACISNPDFITEERIANDKIFYAVDEKGDGGYYSYTSEGFLIGHGTTATTSSGEASSLIDIRNAAIVLMLIVLMIAAFFAIKKIVRKFRSNKLERDHERLEKQAEKTKQSKSHNIRRKVSGLFEKNQYLFVIKELTSREIRRKYVGSKLGILWSVLNPLLMMVTMTLIFSFMFRRSIENFPLYYLAGSIMWTLFSEVTNTAMTSLLDNKMLLMRTKLPLHTFVLSRAYTALTNFLYTLVPFVLLLIIYRIRPSLSMLLFPLDVLLTMIMSVGISYILSILYVYFKDIKYLYGVFLRILMYLTALFYPVSSLPKGLQEVIGYNPVYMSVYIARETVIYGRFPEYEAWIKLAVFSFVSLGIGILVFNRNRNGVMSRI